MAVSFSGDVSRRFMLHRAVIRRPGFWAQHLPATMNLQGFRFSRRIEYRRSPVGSAKGKDNLCCVLF
ncbi:hypothetical protein [Pseudopontixanthobacter vadosimaris]|uniref:hypothetical protein n=1 Tax=Pseudopontixanthobacter vadosimaris TaxID=2726450 RepID=UPI00147515F3|nr:hypothetical protein [Pseudopontixanthobacter vadosimaris]